MFAGCNNGAIVDEEGGLYIIDDEYLQTHPLRLAFPAPVIDVAFNFSFICVLTIDGHVLANRIFNNWTESFIDVPQLAGIKIKKISGHVDTCAALTSDGRVFIYGSNEYGQFGNGTVISNYESFVEVKLGEEIIDVSCSNHTLFLTKSKKVFGCGENQCLQLHKDDFKNYLTSIQIVEVVDQVISMNEFSMILSGTEPLENPAMKLFQMTQGMNEKNRKSIIAKHNIFEVNRSFIHMKTAMENVDLREKINQIMLICHSQSKNINRLTEMVQSLQQQVEIHNKKFIEINTMNMREIIEMKEELQHQNQLIQVMYDEINKNQNTAISDQDSF